MTGDPAEATTTAGRYPVPALRADSQSGSRYHGGCPAKRKWTAKQ